MTSARRMKMEMTRKDLAQRRPPAFDEQLAALTPQDRHEVERFRVFLRDQGMPLADLIDKHGADYLGFTEAEAADVRARDRTRRASARQGRGRSLKSPVTK